MEKNPSRVKKLRESEHNLSFWFHLLITLLAWLGPFLFSWYLMVTAYGIVLLQFLIFKRCLLNKSHALEDAEDATFYSYLLELLGFKVNRTLLKLWVRRYVYFLLAAFTLVWQLWLGYNPLLF